MSWMEEEENGNEAHHEGMNREETSKRFSATECLLDRKL